MSHASVASARAVAPIAGFRAIRRVSRRVNVVPRAVAAGGTANLSSLDDAIASVASVPDATDRLKALIACGADLVDLPDEAKALQNRVMGCASEAWIDLTLAADGTVVVRGAAEAQITRGFCGVLAKGLTGLTADAIADVPVSIVDALGVGAANLPTSRANGFRNMLETAKKQARRLRDARDDANVNESPFPSLVVSADGVVANGVFAETQAEYLEPDPSMVDELVNTLRAKKIGIVAHFYMDAQVQGVLAAARKQYEHVFISDSLVMADAAVKMVDAGCEAIAVLGVDFMSENVRAILDDAGKTEAKVYRMAADDIGCSLAEAAQSESYYAYLDAAREVIADGEPAAHVIYINTALDTKANANAVVPTVTCTSSNVVQTVLQLAAQVPGVNVFYGPDTYMGGNLAHLFAVMAEWSDDEVRAVHPEHTASSIKALLPRLRYYQDGTCVVHHMFGGDVCAAVEKHYGDAYVTAHFEVPGEMFKLATRAARERDMGVVGSTKNILDFVIEKVDEAIGRKLPSGERLSFVLGTETGMVTAIVRAARERLRDARARAEDGACLVECEIVFPVSTDAVTNVEQTTTADASTSASPKLLGGALDGLTIVPGPAGGEGCAADGGCASCPYMKMNSLAALRGVLDKVGTDAAGESLLAPFEPKKYAASGSGPSVAALGCVPILHMRDFTRDKRFSDAFVRDIVGRG
jgi:quinolinate synthase